MQRRWEEQLAGYGMEAWGHAQFISWPLGSLLVNSVPRVLSPDLSSALSRVMASCAYRLIAHRWQVEDKLVNLSPGMAVTVEIKTGSRAYHKLSAVSSAQIQAGDASRKIERATMQHTAAWELYKGRQARDRGKFSVANSPRTHAYSLPDALPPP